MKRTKLIVIIALCLAIVGVGSYYLISFRASSNKTTLATVPGKFGWQFPAGATKFPSTGSAAGGDQAYSDIRDPGGIPEGLPVRLKIPVIGVDSAIEDALITPDGRMDVPAGSVNVAWFALGPKPGEKGSAVIGGHFGISRGVPFVFYDLDKLVVGNKIYILDDKGQTLAFQIRSIKSYDRNADATPVFASKDGLAHLNLITCEGTWNQVNGNYPQRLVIFTDQITGEGGAPVATKAPAASISTVSTAGASLDLTFLRPLGIGSSGADVTALQTFLEQRGLLTLPSGTVNGYFGALTGAAIARYQTSASLPASGTFGPLTRAKILAELGGITSLPNMGTNPDQVSQVQIPTDALAVSSDTNNPYASPQAVPTQTTPGTLQNLFETPLDAIITSLLLICIAFVAFKIIR